MSKLSLTLCTFSITGSVAGLFLTYIIILSVGKLKGIDIYMGFNAMHGIDQAKQANKAF